MKKTIFDLCTDVTDCFVAVIEVRLFLWFSMSLFFLFSLFSVRIRVNALSEKEMPPKGARERSSDGGHDFPRLIWLHTFSVRNSRHFHFLPLTSMNSTELCSNCCLNFRSHDLSIFPRFAPWLVNGCRGEQSQ